MYLDIYIYTYRCVYKYTVIPYLYRYNETLLSSDYKCHYTDRDLRSEEVSFASKSPLHFKYVLDLNP